THSSFHNAHLAANYSSQDPCNNYRGTCLNPRIHLSCRSESREAYCWTQDLSKTHCDTCLSLRTHSSFHNEHQAANCSLQDQSNNYRGTCSLHNNRSKTDRCILDWCKSWPCSKARLDRT